MTDFAELYQRIARIEARQAIGELPARYALAVDSRNLDAWVALFIEDVNCGKRGQGRDLLKSIIEADLKTFYRSIHQICGQTIDFIDNDTATGTVYCRAEHEDGGKWIVMAIVYFDRYVRRNGQWFFERRKEKHWYAADMLDRPAPPFNMWHRLPDLPPELPAAFPTWEPFWKEAGKDVIGTLIRQT